MKSKMKYVIRFLFSIALTAVLVLAGALVSQGRDESFINQMGFVALGIMIFTAVLILLNVVCTKRYSQAKQASVRRMQEHLLSRREEAINDLPRVVRRMVFFRRITVAYTLFILLLAVASAFLTGFGGKAGFSVFPMYLFYGFFGRLLPRLHKADFSEYTKPEDYPTLHAIARRALDTLGHKGEIRIMLLPDCNAGIARIGKILSLQLGAELLDCLSEEELYQVLLHEAAHQTKDSNPADREHRLFVFITERDDSNLSNLLNLLFQFTDIVYVYEYLIYRLTASAVIETIADRAILKHGDPRTAANALGKIAFNALFDEELSMHLDAPLLASETPCEHYLTKLITAFRQAVPVRESFWRTLLQNEIQARSASHPILRTRLENLGVSDYEITFPEEVGAYREECHKAVLYFDEILFKDLSEDYEKKREEGYLCHIRVIEEWQNRETPLAAEESRNVINALMSLDRYAEAEALCDSIIASTDNVYATAHALMAKGVCCLKRYDKEGIEYIYRAMEVNQNYVEGGLNWIGEFCCRMGLEKELEEYREKAVEIQQEQKDTYDHTGDLTPRDRLVADTMPKEMLESILSYIESIDHGDVEAIFLVRKIVTESYFSSAFVVKFKDNTQDQALDDFMDALFNHLDTRPEDWQFSLFLYDKITAAAVHKVKDSCVYRPDAK